MGAHQQRPRRFARSSRVLVAVRAARCVTAVLRRLGRGGTVAGGHVFVAVAGRDGIAGLAQGRRICVVSGTNGKTTTTALITAAIARIEPVVSNVEGANLLSGVATTLAAAPTSVAAVLEVDEAALPAVIGALEPDVCVLLNLTRDQQDRHSEVKMVADRWRDALSAHPSTTVIANADDPLVVWAAGTALSVRWIAGGLAWDYDSRCCPSCGGLVQRDGTAWWCECGLARPATEERPTTPVTSLPGPYNFGNALMAVAAAVAFGANPIGARSAVRSVTSVRGRFAEIRIGSVHAVLMLAKNPAGWVGMFDTLPPKSDRQLVILANAQTADGTDTSWLWDVPFERLRKRPVVVGGERRWDLAVRLAYAEVPHVVIDGPPDAVVSAAGSNEVDLVANYSAFARLARHVA